MRPSKAVAGVGFAPLLLFLPRGQFAASPYGPGRGQVTLPVSRGPGDICHRSPEVSTLFSPQCRPQSTRPINALPGTCSVSMAAMHGPPREDSWVKGVIAVICFIEKSLFGGEGGEQKQTEV